MSTRGLVPWSWRADPSPPEPEGAVAWHAAAGALHARLTRLPREAQARLLVSSGSGLIVVTGAAADLPWVEGIAYAVRCAHAPSLWRPTLQTPDVPADLLARALQRRHGREPLLLWPEPAAVVPLDRQLPLTPQVLAHVAARWQTP